MKRILTDEEIKEEEEQEKREEAKHLKAIFGQHHASPRYSCFCGACRAYRRLREEYK